jgi:ribosome-interacting GTPase 1
MGLPEKIKAIEEEMSKTQIHKQTEHHIGLLKAKLAKLKGQVEQSGSSKQGGIGFEPKKSGDCSVVLIGLPSVGKSTILNRVTDLIMLILDVFQPAQLKVLKKELHKMGVRLNTHPPDVTIEKSSRGGLGITSTCKLTKLSKATVRDILNVYGIQHGNVIIREDISDDELIDVVTGNRRYIPAIVVLNKIDLVNPEYLIQVKKQIGEEFTPISADQKINIEDLKEVIYNKLNFIRVYLKPRSKEADLEEPLIVTDGSTISDICTKIHRKFSEKAKYALVSGTSVKFNSQRVGKDHILQDQDIVTIVT